MDNLLRMVKDAIMNHTSEQQQQGYDPNGLLSHVEGLFGQHQQRQGNVRPASEDPYGDPAEMEQPRQQFRNLRPASEDPYGDPADQQQTSGLASRFRNLRPASEDPYGDPADQ